MIIDKLVYGKNNNPYRIRAIFGENNFEIRLLIFDNGDTHFVKNQKYMFTPTKKELVLRMGWIVESYEKSKEEKLEHLNLDDWDGKLSSIKYV